MAVRCLLALVLLLAATRHAVSQDDTQASPTNWTSAQGKAIAADFVSLDDAAVTLRLKSNGKEVTVPLASLSLESHLQALKLADPAAFSKPLVKAPEIPVIEDFEPTITITGGELLKSPFLADPTIEQFLDTVNAEIERGNLFVAWHALPPKMQTDVEAVLVKNMSTMTPAQMAQIRSLLKAVDRIVHEKRDFILNHSAVAANPELVADLMQQWPKIASLTTALSADSLWQVDNLRAGKIVPWLANISAVYAPYVYEGMLVVKEMHGKPLQYTIATQSSDSANVELKLPNAPEPLKVRFQKVGGIWLVPEWMNQMRAGVDTALQTKPVDLAQLNTGLLILNAMVGSLQRAQTQEEFDAAVEQLVALGSQGMSSPAGAQPSPAPSSPSAQSSGGGKPSLSVAPSSSP